ncbi:stage II sporulation protein E [Bacillus haynesii]|uniref:stage II sporulation protein E n=1 Tax=Bacillus haynesii TaxID=1925021 RepID=UPI0022829B6A|nr:stage II sporulation protein E [Bacillus haynesii]MCY8652148.1 stage II sporulation protein E [Bacillus haynesii]MCY9413692.1 stage II sporulation protein E [Bacillus haynesii]
MEKAERRVNSPIAGPAVQKLYSWFGSMTKLVMQHLYSLFFYKGLIYMVIGFLLGRAFILSEVIPFALPFFGAMLLIKKDKAFLACLALLAGALSISPKHSLFVLAALFAFAICSKMTSLIIKDRVRTLPVVVFLAMAVTRCGFVYAEYGTVSGYHYIMAFVEAGLSFILTLIFLQSLPIVTSKRAKQSLKIEEIICFMILIASVLTGLTGVSFQGMQAELILARYVVLAFAFIGGASIGCTVGVVTGLILSLSNIGNLYQMSLLAFSGLLGGLLKEGKKFGAAVGLLIGSLLISLYGEGSAELVPTLYESLIAIGLFLLTPQSITKKVAKYIPGTTEHAQEQQQYARKIRDVTAQKVDQFSSVFHALSESFATFYHSVPDDEGKEKEIDLFLSTVTEHSCQSCYKKNKCWVQNFDKTYDLMKRVMQETEEKQYFKNRKLKKEFHQHCSKSKQVEALMEDELTHFRANQTLKQKVHDSRRLVAEQLLGVSQVMADFSREIKREREQHFIQEEQIRDALQHFGIEIQQVEIYSLEQGNIDIEMSVPYCNGHGECEKIIAPMLSDILEEQIIVKAEQCAGHPNGYCHVAFGSAKSYRVVTGAAHAAKGGGLVSGDSYNMMELGTGKYAAAISDGMGNGARAHFESNETIKLLEKILQSGIDEKVAIKTINSILSLRTTDEIYSTLDLSVIDLQDASCKFLKIGSTPSFIKRGDQIIKVQASNLPIGIITEFDVDVVSEQLKAGDLLIMMSDGIFEGPRHVENHDLWMKRKLKSLKTEEPQEIADLIMEEVIRTRSGLIEDDMTVIVIKLDHNTPKWASIPAPAFFQKNQEIS